MADSALPPIQFSKPFGAGMGKSKTPLSGAARRSEEDTARFFAGNQFGKPFKGMGGARPAGRAAVLKQAGKKKGKKKGKGKGKGTRLSGAAIRSAAETERFFSGNQFGTPFAGMGGPYKAG
jgi:hypothetical protein